MNDKTKADRVQLSLRFDKYAELLQEAKHFSQLHSIPLVQLVAEGLRLAMTSHLEASHEETQLNTNRLATVEERLAELEKRQTTTSQRQDERLATPNTESLREMLESLIEERLSHHNAILNDLNHRLAKLEELQPEKPESFTPTEIESVKREAAIAPTPSPTGEQLETEALTASDRSFAEDNQLTKLDSGLLKSFCFNVNAILKSKHLHFQPQLLQQKVREILYDEKFEMSRRTQDKVVDILFEKFKIFRGQRTITEKTKPNDNPLCPHCGTMTTKNGSDDGKPKYQCKNPSCKKQHIGKK